MKLPASFAAEGQAAAVRIPVEAYVSRDYARAERDRLWRKVWLQAGRVEDLPEPGNYITYDIMDDSVLIVRGDDGQLRAFHNVCTHRGRRLVDTPAGQRNARGKKMNLVCGFHAWTFNTHGACTYIQSREDWDGALTDADNAQLWAHMLNPSLAASADYDPLTSFSPEHSLLDNFWNSEIRGRAGRGVVRRCHEEAAPLVVWAPPASALAVSRVCSASPTAVASSTSMTGMPSRTG